MADKTPHIVVGKTGEDWEPSTDQKYYAQLLRSDPTDIAITKADYVFGPTPVAALEALLKVLNHG